VPDHWRSVALAPPRAFPPLAVTGRLRATPEDFVVDERLDFEPDGEGEHLLLRVRKRGTNTEWVARRLAHHARVPTSHVGFAGLKDRHAVAEQWFSVPQRATGSRSWLELREPGFEVLNVHGHRRKLRRGTLAANYFRIRIRELRGEPESIFERLALIRERGVPNYFGPQRFGRDGNNLAMLAGWTLAGRGIRARSERGFTLSAGRSLLFNAVLAERVRRCDWERLLPGDVANLDGSGSVFEIEAPSPELEQRSAKLEIHPTGPQWGQGSSPAGGLAGELENAVVGQFGSVPGALETVGLVHERRSLRLRVAELEARHADDGLEITFRLGRGQFATAVLRELGELTTGGAPA
jgi:tRNA pseudouridine13 synthase